MADTIPNITLPRGVWVNAYADTGVIAAGITAGTPIEAKNESHETIHMYSAAIAPVGLDYGRSTMQAWEAYTNDTGDSGAWFLAVAGEGLINIRAV